LELFRNANIDWLGKKWYFLGFSLVFSVAGVISMVAWHGIPRGVDFKGGTQVTLQFDSAPNEDHIRQALDAAHIRDYKLQSVSNSGELDSNREVITVPEDSASSHDKAADAVDSALKAGYHDSGFKRDKLGIVSATASKELTHQAFLATVYSLIGMLIYLWFRFELIYGVAAVVAVFHDTLITIGFFSLTNQEITLTVVAAILTLVGYSMNDTIVVFDRIRENLALNRKESLSDVVNRSINQTLSRTVIASGLTFLTVLCLYVFGGEVLHGFSFALVVGILIGTYSSIAVAAPMLVAYQDWRAARGKRAVLPAARGRR
jgi:preprotein translocase subunit SecF